MKAGPGNLPYGVGSRRHPNVREAKLHAVLAPCMHACILLCACTPNSALCAWPGCSGGNAYGGGLAWTLQRWLAESVVAADMSGGVAERQRRAVKVGTGGG